MWVHEKPFSPTGILNVEQWAKYLGNYFRRIDIFDLLKGVCTLRSPNFFVPSHLTYNSFEILKFNYVNFIYVVLKLIIQRCSNTLWQHRGSIVLL
jgi:hypothetical protein